MSRLSKNDRYEAEFTKKDGNVVKAFLEYKNGEYHLTGETGNFIAKGPNVRTLRERGYKVGNFRKLAKNAEQGLERTEQRAKEPVAS